MSDFLVVGAGINGLLVARELAQLGAEVTLIDRGVAGGESSWAGGGIVSPLYPWHYPAPVTELASWSQQHYQQLVEDLIEETAVDPEYVVSGLLMLTPDDEQAALSWAATNNRKMEQVDADFIYAKESRLAPGFRSALWMSDVANVRNPRLCRALKHSLEAKTNVRLIEHCELLELERKENRINAAIVQNQQSAPREKLEANQYVFCSGAWTYDLLRSTGVEIFVKPVKGQMLLYKFDDKPLETILLTEGRYFIPRIDGHVLAGATIEHCGYDKSTTQSAKEELHAAVAKHFPDLSGLKPINQWAGLRPGSDDGMPYIGQVACFDNLHVSTGHFRNGLLLAPASARLLVDLLMSNTPIIDPAPFAPDNREVASV